MVNLLTKVPPVPNVNPATPNLINGEMIDDTVAGDGNGTQVEKEVYSDLYYGLIAIMNYAGIVADNSEEGAITSQFLDSFKIAVKLPAYRVRDQTTFNNLFIRSAPNVYSINSSVTSVVFDPGNYLVSGILTDGDTWGDIQTTNCISLEAKNGVTIDFETLNGKILVNTDNCLLENIHITGGTSTDVNLIACFETLAKNVTFSNCRASDRVSARPGGFLAFYTVTTEINMLTTKYINCHVTNISNTAGGTWGFFNAWNLTDCSVFSITSVNDIIGFQGCVNVSNFQIYDIESTLGNVTGFDDCQQVDNGRIKNLDTAGTGTVKGIYNSRRVNNVSVEAVTASGTGQALGFDLCNQSSGCKAYDISTTGAAIASGYNSCSNISSSIAEKIDTVSTGESIGFVDCFQLSACQALDIDTTGNAAAIGFKTCLQVSGCKAIDIQSSSASEASGFKNCDQINSCYVEQIDNTSSGPVFGFVNCNQINGCGVYDIATTGNGNAKAFSICLNISGCSADKVDAGGTGSSEGFSGCNQISSCYATDIDSVSGGVGGFVSCLYGSALYTTEAVNSLNDFMDCTDPQIATQQSIQNFFT